MVANFAVSAVGLGCWNFGRTIDRSQSEAVVHAALDAGVAFFDVADNYGYGTAEESLGHGLRGHLDDAVIATKFGAGRGAGHRTALGHRSNTGGGDPAYIRESVETSLRRLRRDHIDLLQMHDPDPATPLEVTLGALDELVQSGKVRTIGCSNATAAHLVEAAGVADARELTRFATVQNQCSVLHHLPREEVLPACRELGMKLLPYFPLANGVLTGKYAGADAVPEDTRIGGFKAAHRDDKAARFLNPTNSARVERLTAFAAERGRSLLELAFGWLLTFPEVACVIPGASTPAQVRANSRASGWRLTPEEMTEVDALLDDGAPILCVEPDAMAHEMSAASPPGT